MTDTKFSTKDVTQRIRTFVHDGQEGQECNTLTLGEIPLRYDIAKDELHYATKNDFDLNEATLGIFMVTFLLVKDVLAKRDAKLAREVQKQLITLRETLR